MSVSDEYTEQHGVLRFHVPLGQRQVVAFLSRAICHARGGPAARLSSLADFYRQHQGMLEGIVVGKLEAGARAPVVLTARDLCQQAPSERDGRDVGFD